MNEQKHGSASLIRLVAASVIGTAIEFYDFFLYATAAALVFGKEFFPSSNPLTGIFLAFLSYAFGFVVRPLGGVVFGHIGDKYGRRFALILTLSLMGGATCLMGLLPTFSQVGVLAPLLLTFLRLVQGFALGGEWGGAVLLVAEHGSAKNRGFWTSLPQTGGPLGNLLSTAVLFVLSSTMSNDAFLSWVAGAWLAPEARGKALR
jgi:MFS family permease